MQHSVCGSEDWEKMWNNPADNKVSHEDGNKELQVPD